MSLLLILPLLVPLTVATVMLLTWRNIRLHRHLSVIAAALHLGTGLVLLASTLDGSVVALQAGSWPAPFGITLACDLLSAMGMALAGTINMAVAVLERDSMDSRRETHGCHALVQFLILGASGALLSGDLFNLYVWLEVMMISSFVLIVLGGERAQVEGGLRHVAMHLLSSACFLASIGLLYGIAGTLNLADLAIAMADPDHGSVAHAVSLLLLVALGIRSAMFPLFSWLPSAYPASPTAVTALFSGLLTNVGIYALIRVESLVFLREGESLRALLLVLAAATMLFGVLGAIAQTEIKRLLSFHVVSQVGYLLMGLGLFTVASLAATIFFLVHVTLATVTLFLVAAVIERERGTTRLEHLGGLLQSSPRISVVFLVAGLTLAGLPPLSGFWGRLGLVRAGLASGHSWVTAIALIVSLLTLYSMIQIWNAAFWRDAPEGIEDAVQPVGVRMFGPALALAALVVVLGLGAGFVYPACERAAESLLEPSAYVHVGAGR